MTITEKKFIDRDKRKADFMKLIEGLDISPTMFRNATEKYKNLGKFLQKHGIDSEIYPQGSFSLGTVVRPYKEGRDLDYDLDFICKINSNKKCCTPKGIKHGVGYTLKSDEVYRDKLQQEWDKCWTVEYKEVNGIGFNIDIVPAVGESDDVINALQLGYNPYIGTSIAITNKTSNNEYNWSTANPKGYTEWFYSINEPFLEYNRESRLENLLESHRDMYNSIEEIPKEIDRSSLQRVIQILKRHRDIYFSKIRKEDDKPISAIITIVCAKIAIEAEKHLDVLDLLEFIVREFEIYSEKQTLTEAAFSAKYTGKDIIKRIDSEWEIINPANPGDNLADAWNDNPEKAKLFFKWVQVVREDFIKSFGYENDKFINLLENAVGSSYARGMIDFEKYTAKTPEVFSEANAKKPWRG